MDFRLLRKSIFFEAIFCGNFHKLEAWWFYLPLVILGLLAFEMFKVILTRLHESGTVIIWWCAGLCSAYWRRLCGESSSSSRASSSCSRWNFAWGCCEFPGSGLHCLVHCLHDESPLCRGNVLGNGSRLWVWMSYVVMWLLMFSEDNGVSHLLPSLGKQIAFVPELFHFFSCSIFSWQFSKMDQYRHTLLRALHFSIWRSSAWEV